MEIVYFIWKNVNSNVFPYFMKSVPTKQDLKLDITELELAAEMVEKEEEEKWKMQALNMTLELHLSDEEESRYEYQTPMWT